MYSVMEKLTGIEEGCLNILFETFLLENLWYIFYEIKAEKELKDFFNKNSSSIKNTCIPCCFLLLAQTKHLAHGPN